MRERPLVGQSGKHLICYGTDYDTIRPLSGSYRHLHKCVTLVEQDLYVQKIYPIKGTSIMKLICKQCRAVIPTSDTNIQEGICFCAKCGEYFRIASFLRFGDVVGRMKKPDYTQVKALVSASTISFVLPPLGWKGRTKNWLFGSLAWNAILWLIGIYDKEMLFFMVPFMLVGIGLILVFLFHLKGTTMLHVNDFQVIASWRLFRFEYTKKGRTDTISDVGINTIYLESYQPVNGIGIKFKNGKSIKFGSNLSELEQKWIAGEILAYIKS